MRYALLLLLPLTLPSFVEGQNPVQSVLGIVRGVGDSGAPLADAEVLIGKRQTTTDLKGKFRIDSMPSGQYPITIRHIGYSPIRSRIVVVTWQPTEAEFFMVPAPFLLPEIVVESRRTGIFGVVGDFSYQPIQGAKVEVLGNRGGEAFTDTLGRFAFPNANNGAYLVRVRRSGYQERRVMVEVERDKGRQLGLQLLSGAGRRASHSEEAALFDLGRSLAFDFRRTRMLGPELERYGSMSVCDVPRVRLVVGSEQIGFLNGETKLLPGQLCSWQMDEIGLIQFVNGKIRYGPSGPSRSSGYVVIWEKR